MEKRKPEWLKIKFQDPKHINKVERLLKGLSLHTVCQEATCPNRMECFNKGTATFMILGSVCTRGCRYCDVEKGKPNGVDSSEPENLAKATKELKLRHVVITSVTRDDLEDGGADQFVKCIEKVRETSKGTSIEVLIPDLQGNEEALAKIVAAAPEILNHNIETVPSLFKTIRPGADYQQSLQLLANVKKMNPKIFTKSGLMVGLGETEEEVVRVFADLRDVGCDFLTVGQYLQPSKKHIAVAEYIHPDIFKDYEKVAYEMGFKHVASGPFVRSSYNAEQTKILIDAQ
ncbi:MAG: lipoate synthase [Fusobacteria bacterium]|nr:MAG: lipoate synthase [Fusobacteriota bacterium]KAF0228923.1 MAG: lipoate [Fusobacteriota bacterium]